MFLYLYYDSQIQVYPHQADSLKKYLTSAVNSLVCEEVHLKK